MKGLKILLFAMVSCFLSASLHADIYEWTDENGVKHFTNYSPPADATILIKTEEVPYDEEADRARMEAERQRALELARLEIAEKEAEIERRLAEAEQKAAEAERYSAKVREKADDYLEEAKSNRRHYSSYGTLRFYRPPHHYVIPGKRYYFKRSHYGQSRNNLLLKYKHKERLSRKAYVGKRGLKYSGKKVYNTVRIGSREKGYHPYRRFRGDRSDLNPN
jgi:hypothetical protein